ncbi:hypothetical protein E2C01_027732 [Portunus trituberculatus]|uniref:RNase H type-1 domain-containing protein n=1 Tax=Portunus trituberculatus TaxID=210409 RepID=A0A5B7EM40_PORTR|nr:hypothetical protein [Portunus trituberculatus]
MPCPAMEQRLRIVPDFSISELLAIQGALQHSLLSPADTVVHTDFLTAVRALSHPTLKENVELVTGILHSPESLRSQGYSIKLSWVPSHTGISENDRADAATKTVATLNHGGRRGTVEPCVLWDPSGLQAHGFESCPRSECRLGFLTRGNGFLAGGL